MFLSELLSVLLFILGFAHGLGRYKRIVGGDPAPEPPVDDPVVYIYKDSDQALIRGTREGPYYAFRGIRYANPPVGMFRFQRPQRTFISGSYNATKPPPPCPQPDPRNNGGIIGSEDCLFLNVFTPSLPDGSGSLPVLFWIHGGGFRRGSASQYGVNPLLNKNLVVVTIQYRLGSLGFISGASRELPGNVGLFDMSLALDWVRDYISFFGGNPSLIKACGQGTGASSAILLSMSKITQGLIGGVLALSGSALSTFAIDSDPIGTTKDLASRHRCPTSPMLELVRCMQQLPTSTIINGDSGLQAMRLAASGLLAGLTGLLGSAPVSDEGYDRRFLPSFLVKNPTDVLKLGEFPNIPLLTGVTKDETSTAILGDYHKDILNKITSVPGYVDSVVGNLLSKTASGLTNTTINILQTITGNSLGTLTGGVTSGVNKLIEVTGDALFNLPAFRTASLWTKKNNSVFLYSFEYKGKEKGGPHFLAGLPLVQAAETTAPNIGIGHGDDLPFIFDALPLDGNELPGNTFKLTDPKDLKVQDMMTKYIANFARFGAPTSPTDGKVAWPSFTESKNNFLKISDKPEADTDFRFCQMALWAGLLDRLQTGSCQTLNIINNVVSLLPLPTNNLLGLGGNRNKNNTANKPLGILGL